MKHLDLFSGIGGFALATEMVWPDVEHIFCDNELYAQEILKKHWPNAPIFGDIRTLTYAKVREQQQLAMEREPDTQDTIAVGAGSSTANAESKQNRRVQQSKLPPDFTAGVDLLTGGFPCQPFSAAGQRRGTEDDRHLWPEMLRVIREFKPRWIIGENVGGLVTWSGGMVLEQIHLDLEAEGYEVQAFIIPAVALNAPHRRDRIWIVAHRLSDAEGSTHGTASRERGGEDPHVSEGDKVWGDTANSNTQSHTNPAGKGLEGGRKAKGQRVQSGGAQRYQRPNWDKNWPEVAAELCRVDDGIPRRLDRTSRLKGLGNAIVPQVAAQIMEAIKKHGN